MNYLFDVCSTVVDRRSGSRACLFEIKTKFDLCGNSSFEKSRAKTANRSASLNNGRIRRFETLMERNLFISSTNTIFN